MDTVGQLQETLRVLIRVTGELAQFCDRAEHNESTDRTVITASGADLRQAALKLLTAHRIDVPYAYAQRLVGIEARHPRAGSQGIFDAASVVPHAKTWRDFQWAQADHDAAYHPDVMGLAKLDQLRHYTLHLAKLVWKLDAASHSGEFDADFKQRSVDVLIFGVKLASVCGQSLSEEPFDLMT